MSIKYNGGYIPAVGADGTTLVANSASATGVAWAGPSVAAGKNFLINGGMDIWQRGTSFSIALGTPQYTADRWTNYFNAAGTVTQDTSLVQTGQKYGLRVTASANSIGNTMYQVVETFNTLPLAGQTVTLSAWVAGTSGKTPYVGIDYSTNTDDIFLGTYTAITGTAIKSVTSSGTFQQVVYNFAIPSTAKTLRVVLYSNGMNNTDYLTWSKAQLELGSVPTAFSRAGGTIQGELAACQRYYYRNTAPGGYTSLTNFSNTANATNQVYYVVNTPVPMRTANTVVDWGGNIGLSDGITTSTNISSIASSGGVGNVQTVNITMSSAVLTQYRAYKIADNGSGTAYFGIGCEL